MALEDSFYSTCILSSFKNLGKICIQRNICILCVQFNEFQQIKHSNQDIKYFHHPKNFFYFYPTKLHTSLRNYCVNFYLHILEVYVNLIKQYILFCVWLILVMSILRFVIVIGNISGLFFSYS